jgi:hypothetical protein
MTKAKKIWKNDKKLQMCKSECVSGWKRERERINKTTDLVTMFTLLLEFSDCFLLFYFISNQQESQIKTNGK